MSGIAPLVSFHGGDSVRKNANGDGMTAYYIAFGAHGPRALPPPGEGWKVAGYVGIGMALSFGLFVAIRMGAGPSPSTMNKEYQEATNEYLKVRLSLHLCLECFGWSGVLRVPVRGEWSDGERDPRGEVRVAELDGIDA